jgi:DNA primase
MASYQETLDEIWQVFKHNASLYAVALQNLKPRVTPVRIYCICPRCNDRSGYVIPGQSIIKCNHENTCNQSSILGHLIGQCDPPKKEDFKRAIDILCGIAGVAVPEFSQTIQHSQRINHDAISTLYQISKQFLSSSANAGSDYLLQRGFTADFCSEHFGWLPSVAVASSVLSDSEMRSIGLLDSNADPVESWNERIIIPGYDANGKLIGLIGRSLDDRTDKYRNTTGYSPASIGGFGIHKAKKFERVVLVEGIFDVLKQWQYGLFNTLAAGTNNYSLDNLVALSGFGVREIVSALDSDVAGIKGTWNLLNNCDQTGEAPDPFVVTWTGNGKMDADRFITDTGAAAFRELCDRALYGARFRARNWFDDLQRDADGILLDGQLLRFIERCANYTANDRRVDLRLNTYFVPEVCKLAGIEISEFQELRAEYKHKAREGETIKSFVDSLNQAIRHAQEGKLENACERTLEAVERSRTQPGVYASAVPMGAHVLQEAESFLQKIASREFLGIPIRSIPSLDINMYGLHGLILLAGDTNIGKTILLGQLAMDACWFNSDVCVLFLTLEMSRKTLLLRMWSRLAQLDWRDLRHAYTIDSHAYKAKIEAAKRELEYYTNQIKIIHPRTDKHFVVSERTLINEIADLKQRTGRKRCMVVIDYLDVMPTPPGWENRDRNEIDKEMCNQLLNLKEALGEDDPLIVVTEVRKRDTKNRSALITLDDVMGSARKGYATDSVLIWNRYNEVMLYENLEIVEGHISGLIEPYDITDAEAKKPETRRAIKELKRIMDRDGINLGRLEIAKVRDGGNKATFDLTIHYRKNYIDEGINGHGEP